MARPAPGELDDVETITLPRGVRFPVELDPPPGFDPARLETWPQVVGRLEGVEGRMLYMPGCGDLQQDTVTDVVATLAIWGRAHPEFVVGTNEAGLRLGKDTRAADAAVWRRADLGPYTKGFRTVPPVLAVEVTSREEPPLALREKARWYLDAGVSVVWIVVPEQREVLVITREGDSRHGRGDRLPPHSQLPDLAPAVDDLFFQISRAD